MTHTARRIRLLLAVLIACCILVPSYATAQETIAEATEGLERQDGFLPLYWNETKGTLLLEIPELDEPFLYLTSLATGMGVNGLGMDRGQIGDEAVAHFERVGPKVLLVLDHPSFRAVNTDNEALLQSVEESFPTSTIGQFDVVAETEGRVLIDITGFAIRDVMNVRGGMRRAREGNFSLNRDRSVIYLPRTKAFPRNTEIEVSLTFTSDDPGARVRQHTPDGRAVTIRQHHSFIRLPEPGFRPRAFDPRVGIFAVRFFDYSQPFDGHYEQRYAVRHRLIKRNPGAQMSEPVEPIVYYLDRGVPEPYRTAFKEGAGWYNQVFEAAGFRNAFRVEDMPDDMDPLDARYDVIQWVHRTDPGSSIGPSFVDPRTGEIIKAAVRMDSHRSVVDFNIYAAALPGLDAESALQLMEAETAIGDWIAGMAPDVTAEEFAMARRRQHAAHEVGHTLGLAHNFIAASYGRASVMDYPAPYITWQNGQFALRDAYREGPGAYDSLAIRWAYSEFDPEDEAEQLNTIAVDGIRRGIAFITNPDENPSSSHPEGTTWINGSNTLEELRRLMDVRRALIDAFDETAIREGEPMSMLNTRFVALYLQHRFSITAATKAIGGMRFRYALRGDPAPPTEIVAPEVQQAALELLLDAIEPEELAIPERILALMAPRPFGYSTDRRAFGSAATPAFDQVGVARTLSRMVVAGIFAPQRTARLVAFNARNPEQPSLESIVQRVIARTWSREADTEYGALQRVVDRVVLDELIRLASNADATVESRAAAAWGVQQIAEQMQNTEPANAQQDAHFTMAAMDIRRFFNRMEMATDPSAPIPPPPGTPIGGRR